MAEQFHRKARVSCFGVWSRCALEFFGLDRRDEWEKTFRPKFSFVGGVSDKDVDGIPRTAIQFFAKKTADQFDRTVVYEVRCGAAEIWDEPEFNIGRDSGFPSLDEILIQAASFAAPMNIHFDGGFGKEYIILIEQARSDDLVDRRHGAVREYDIVLDDVQVIGAIGAALQQHVMGQEASEFTVGEPRRGEAC